MSASEIMLADQLVAALNAGAWSLRCEARRGYVPPAKADERARPAILVTPRTVEAARESRGSATWGVDLGLAIFQNVDREQNLEQIDALMAFREELADWLLFGFDAAPFALDRIDLSRSYNPRLLAEKHLFLSVLWPHFVSRKRP